MVYMRVWSKSRGVSRALDGTSPKFQRVTRSGGNSGSGSNDHNESGLSRLNQSCPPTPPRNFPLSTMVHRRSAMTTKVQPCLCRRPASAVLRSPPSHLVWARVLHTGFPKYSPALVEDCSPDRKTPQFLNPTMWHSASLLTCIILAHH